MKQRLFLLIVIVLMLFSCTNKNEEKENLQNSEVEIKEVKKIDDLKEYVYFTNYKNLILDNGNEYILKNAYVNLDSEEVKTINLELKNFVLKSYKNLGIENKKVIYGNVISYDYYITEEYISLLQHSSYYINGSLGVANTNIYVINIKNGKIVDNDELMNKFDLTEEKIFEKVRKNLDSDDVEYSIMNMKNNYSLYINNDNKLVLSFIEINNEEEIKRELILN